MIDNQNNILPTFAGIRDQLGTVSRHLDDQQLMMLADDLHAVIRQRLALGLRSRRGPVCCFGDVVFEQGPERDWSLTAAR